MAKYKDVIDLYDDNGKLLKSNVALEKISPLVNPAIKKIIDDTKRTVAVNLGGMQDALKTGKIGKHQQILGRELNLDIVGNIDAIEAKIKEYVSVEAGDDTMIKRYNGGKLLLVKVPSARIAAAATYDAALTSVAAAQRKHRQSSSIRYLPGHDGSRRRSMFYDHVYPAEQRVSRIRTS